MEGKFIVFSGLDGSGKNEQLKKTIGYLHEKHKHLDIYLTKEPSKGYHGQKIRNDFLNKDKDPLKNARACLEAYVEDRKWHVSNIILPQLGKGNIVICDRYYYETIAYQNAQGIPLDEILYLNKDFPIPNLTLILDIPAEIAYERMEKRDLRRTKFEKIEFLELVRKNFLELENCLTIKEEFFGVEHVPDNIKIINGNRPINEVFEDIKSELDKIISST